MKKNSWYYGQIHCYCNGSTHCGSNWLTPLFTTPNPGQSHTGYGPSVCSECCLHPPPLLPICPTSLFPACPLYRYVSHLLGPFRDVMLTISWYILFSHFGCIHASFSPLNVLFGALQSSSFPWRPAHSMYCYVLATFRFIRSCFSSVNAAFLPSKMSNSPFLTHWFMFPLLSHYFPVLPFPLTLPTFTQVTCVLTLHQFHPCSLMSALSLVSCSLSPPFNCSLSWAMYQICRYFL